VTEPFGLSVTPADAGVLIAAAAMIIAPARNFFITNPLKPRCESLD
jgi:hypothetical protein